MPKLLYTRDDTTLLKGLGILLIILHNFFHVISAFEMPNEIGIECEFDFSAERVTRLLDILAQGNLLDSCFVLFAFLGHYGVSLFVFISGYGLVKRYGESMESGWDILKHRTIQLWKWLLPILSIYVILRYLGFGEHEYANNWELWQKVLLIATFTSNIAGEYFIISGPWWYFGMAFQLYIVYAWLLRKASDKTLWAVIGGTLALQLGLSLAGQTEVIYYLRYNCIGWLPIFCLGMWVARHPVTISWSWLAGGILLSIPSLFVPHLWVFSSTLVLFPLTALLPALRHRIFKKGWRFLGNISVAIFALNAIVRNVIFKALPTDTTLQTFVTGWVFLGVCLIAAWLYYNVLNRLYRRLHW